MSYYGSNYYGGNYYASNYYGAQDTVAEDPIIAVAGGYPRFDRKVRDDEEVLLIINAFLFIRNQDE